MEVTPSEPAVSSEYAKRGMKKRRRSQLHHQLAWWVASETTTEVGPDGEHTNSTSLSEGENWLVCSSITTKPTHPPFSVCIVNNNLHKFSGATTGHPFPLDEALHIRNPKLADDAEESLAGDENRMSNREGIVLLCIDVDDKGKYVAVKDVRLDPAVQHKSAPKNKDMMMGDDIAQAADNIEFFHARRKKYDAPPGETKAKKSNDKIVENGDNGNGDKNNFSSGESTSGYGTDDEEDGTDEVDELKEHNEVRFYDSLGGLPPPSRESDQDDKGRALYHHPELLPRRQLRVFQNGDRILLRYISKKEEGSESNNVSIVKFEYTYGHQHHSSNKRRATFVHVTETDEVQGQSTYGNHTSRQATNGQGKSRLLSVKSADVKSTEKKRFTLNSTSAAEAPTEEEDDYGKTRKASNADMNGHKAGKDWSALEAENDDGLNIEAGKEDNEKNVAKNEGDDDDGGMEEYSYLTGEVVIKDQDYISAITGDEATNAALQPPTAGADNNDDKSDTSDGDNAATASAVVLGAVTSPPKQPREDRNTDRGSNQKEFSSPKRVTLGATTKEENEEKEDVIMADDDDNCENGLIFEEEAVGPAEHSQETAPFFTAPDHDESDDENMSGDELLSPVKPPKKEGAAVQHAVHFDSEALAAVGKDNDEGDGSITDYSLTQPFPIPRNVTEQKRSTSSSTAKEEEDEEEDDDDSTVCPEVEGIDDDKFEGSKPRPIESSKPRPIESKDEEDEDIGVYDEPTQPIQCPPKSLEVFNQSDDDDDYHAETQFDIFTSSKKASIQHAGNESKADNQVAENQNNLKPVIQEKIEEPKPAEEHVIQEGKQIEAAENVCEAAESEQSDHNATKKQSPNKYPGRNNIGEEIFDNSAIEKERLDNSAVHRVQSGAIMTGPVGGAVALASSRPPHLDMPNSLVKTAAMLQSIDPETNPLPDNTAASSEETTVCQMDDAMGKNEADESDHAPATNVEGGNRRKRAIRSPGNQVISGDIGVRDPNIPTEVCITENHHDGETTPRHRASRKRNTPTSGRRKESADTVRVMFTGLAPTQKHKQVNHSLLCMHHLLYLVSLYSPQL